MDELLVNFDGVPLNKLCTICQEFYTTDCNKCSKCLINEYKCIKCKNYFSCDANLKCSVCILYDNYDVTKLTLNDIVNLPSSVFKSELMEMNLEKLYNQFKNKMNLRHRLLANNTEFNLLKSLCHGKNSGEVFTILDGLRSFPAIIMTANYASKLLEDVITGPDNPYMYEHAISPFVLDIWNMPTGSIIECYYKKGTTCPNNHISLFKLWSNLISNTFSRNNVTNTIMFNYTDHLDNIDVYTSDKLIVCANCCWYNPVLITGEEITPLTSECINCKHVFDNVKKNYIILD